MRKACTPLSRNNKVTFDKNKCRHDAHGDGLLKSAKFKASANVFSYHGKINGRCWLHGGLREHCVIPLERSVVMKNVHFCGNWGKRCRHCGVVH